MITAKLASEGLAGAARYRLALEVIAARAALADAIDAVDEAHENLDAKLAAMNKAQAAWRWQHVSA